MAARFSHRAQLQRAKQSGWFTRRSSAPTCMWTKSFAFRASRRFGDCNRSRSICRRRAWERFSKSSRWDGTPPSGTTATITTTVLTPASAASAASSTATSSGLVNYDIARASAISTVPLPCPALDKTTYYGFDSATFNLSGTNSLNQGDLMTLVAYHYQDCLDACATMNYWLVKTTCTKVEFHSTIGETSSYGGNCFPKDSQTTAQYDPKDTTLSAQLNWCFGGTN